MVHTVCTVCVFVGGYGNCLYRIGVVHTVSTVCVFVTIMVHTVHTVWSIRYARYAFLSGDMENSYTPRGRGVMVAIALYLGFGSAPSIPLA